MLLNNIFINIKGLNIVKKTIHHKIPYDRFHTQFDYGYDLFTYCSLENVDLIKRKRRKCLHIPF